MQPSQIASDISISSPLPPQTLYRCGEPAFQTSYPPAYPAYLPIVLLNYPYRLLLPAQYPLLTPPVWALFPPSGSSYGRGAASTEISRNLSGLGRARSYSPALAFLRVAAHYLFPYRPLADRVWFVLLHLLLGRCVCFVFFACCCGCSACITAFFKSRFSRPPAVL